jgi:hypothetical protein
MREMKKMVPLLLAIISTALCAPEVLAQCRMGSGPDFGDGIPYCSQPPPKVVAPSGPQWATRWGAIAIDPKTSKGGVGVATDMKSQRAAEKEAIKRCRSSGGGKTCRIQTSYDNQCGAIASGDNDYMSTANAGTIDDATGLALAECERASSNCRVYYSNCSYPVRIR